jgi:N-acetylglutamate synthase-like GNAT family acetyltransferase
MIIKTFTENLLKPVAKLCRQNMHRDIMPDFLLQEKTLGDPDFEKELTLVGLSEISNSPIAFLQAVIRTRDTGKVGYIKLLCVDSNERRKGYARSLYQNIEQKMKQQQVKLIRVYESFPNYFMPGIDPFYTEAVCFFERLGFKKFGDTSNLIADLSIEKFDTDADEKNLLKEKIIIRRAEEKDKQKMFDWIEKNFPAWHGEVSSAFQNNPITLFIAEREGNITAFSAHEGNNKGTGWFGPMGTDSSLRGKGVGGILLKKCLQDMKEMGFVKAIIPWVGPIPFYMHYANAKVERIFWRYEKIME